MRTLHRMHPKRVVTYWTSRDGILASGKILGLGLLFLLLAFGAIFAFYRRELDAIRPSELAKRVQTTVTRYYDRNDVLLWEDKGVGNYRLVVEEKDISPYMKQATVAIEDKDFYKHGGISFTGITRAFYNNFSGGSTQGGSTLTQQLVKQVFFADEAQKRGLNGVPRKFKEAILAIEVERMYNKDQILNLYLNESPYGGRRNGVESAAQSYFGKPAKDLTLAEASLLAAIPQNPSVYNPYNTEGHDSLIERQQGVLNNMAEQGYITQKEADAAKKVAVLDTVKPEADQYKDLKAPHFVQLVRSQLEKELGKATVGRGGLTVKTSLDMRVQEVVEAQVSALFASSLPRTANFDNGAVTIVDNQTGQVLALQGSRDYNYPGYGQDNAAVSYIQPGSSIKPLVFASLFKQRSGQNYGTGTILKDEPIDQIYGAKLENFDKKYLGNLTIRQGLAQSRNVPAVKAMYIAGRDQTLQTIHDLGDMSYCTQGVDKQVGLAAAIGGCGLKQVEHANAFATLARGGTYKPYATVLEVKNGQGDVIKRWKDSGKQVLDPQVPYMLQSILSDDNARAPSFGRGASGLNVPGVRTFTKTGTSNLGTKSKDLWMNSVSTKVTMSVWVGNHDTRAMSNALSSIVGPTVGRTMSSIHSNIFAKDGTWKTGDWFSQPAGIQTINGELFPSWYQKQAQSTSQMAFDKVSRKKATSCTPEGAKVNIGVTQSQDPVTKKTTVTASDGYDASADDDLHKCDDIKPFVNGATYTTGKVTVTVAPGTHQTLQSLNLTIDGQSLGEKAITAGGAYDFSATLDTAKDHTAVITITDSAYYSTTTTITIPKP
jgi:membrane peptidoglycan carboxypeptidase